MLISKTYLILNKKLHHRNGGYGGSGDKWLPFVCEAIEKCNAESVLDYGCGKGDLVTKLKRVRKHISVVGYDPAIKKHAELPQPADLVVSTDVLEHIEPELLSNVLEHIRDCTKKMFWAYVATHESNKSLPDGRNTHLIVEPYEWWQEQLSQFFPGIECWETPKWNRFVFEWSV